MEGGASGLGGADVEVYAPQAECSEEIKALMARGAAAGSLVLVARHWREADFTDAAVLVADAENDEEASAMRAVAKAAGIPVNVIDRPAFCDFQFGSIVNRSPVVVGISTTGAAPILGQAIRQRIETLLPPALARFLGAVFRLRFRCLSRRARGL